MTKKIGNIFLTIYIGVLAVFLIRANLVGRQLKSEYDRLTAAYGDLPVVNEDAFLVAFRPGESPLRKFRWRVYQPELRNGLSGITRTYHGWSSGNSYEKEPREFRVLASFRVREGQPELYWKNANGASVAHFDRSIHEFVAEHWDEFDFEMLGKSAPIEVDPSQPLQIFEVRIPEKLFGKLPEGLSEKKLEKLKTKPIFEMVLGDSSVVQGP